MRVWGVRPCIHSVLLCCEPLPPTPTQLSTPALLLPLLPATAPPAGPDPCIWLLGLMQSMFEASMYSFVFLWTMALSPNKEAIKHGLIFMNFMTACMLGSYLSGGWVWRKRGGTLELACMQGSFLSGGWVWRKTGGTLNLPACWAAACQVSVCGGPVGARGKRGVPFWACRNSSPCNRGFSQMGWVTDTTAVQHCPLGGAPPGISLQCLNLPASLPWACPDWTCAPAAPVQAS